MTPQNVGALISFLVSRQQLFIGNWRHVGYLRLWLVLLVDIMSPQSAFIHNHGGVRPWGHTGREAGLPDLPGRGAWGTWQKFMQG